MRLILLRHGETHANLEGALDTAEPGEHLTELGRRQARAAADVLRDRPIDAVFTSVLTRTQETAAPLAEARGLEPVAHAGLREVRAGDLEMLADDDSRHAYVHTVASWILGDLDVRMPGGESGHEFLERYDAGIAAATATGAGTILVVSHGAAIRTWAGLRSTGTPEREKATQPLRNTGAIELDGDPETGWQLAAWHTHPIGGAALEDPAALDPTGGDVDDEA